MVFQEGSAIIDEDEPRPEEIPKGVSLTEYLEQTEEDSQTTQLLAELLRENPLLSDVKLVFISPEQEPNTGGIFDIQKTNESTYVPTIFIVENDAEHMAKVLHDRKTSNEIVAGKLGVPFEKMTPELLKTFITFHEWGHARDFLTNYQSNPDYTDSQEAVEEWNSHYEATLHSLPVPGFDPAELRERIGEYSNVKEFIADYPGAKNYIVDHAVVSLEDLLHDQEVAYRDSPYEKYADEFAVTFLRKNAQKVGIPELTD